MAEEISGSQIARNGHGAEADGGGVPAGRPEDGADGVRLTPATRKGYDAGVNDDLRIQNLSARLSNCTAKRKKIEADIEALQKDLQPLTPSDQKWWAEQAKAAKK